MIDVKYNEVKDRNSWIDGNYLNATICVTEDCNLRCSKRKIASTCSKSSDVR